MAENPYSDAVECFGGDEPRAVGAKIASAIRSLMDVVNKEREKMAKQYVVTDEEGSISWNAKTESADTFKTFQAAEVLSPVGAPITQRKA
jgi:hypothetical protein